MKWFELFTKNKWLFFLQSLCLLLALVVVHTFVKRHWKEREARKEQERISRSIAEEETKMISFWYAPLDDVHLIVCPYFFHNQETQFHDKILNDAFRLSPMTYYKLWIVNFHGPSVSFVEGKDTVSLCFSKDKKRHNIPLAKEIQKIPDALRLSLQSLLGQEPIPAGSMKPYLLAFPESATKEVIQGIEIEWQGKAYPMEKVTVLRKDWEEYLQEPKSDFWKKK